MNVIRIFNINQGLFEEIKYHFVIPYTDGLLFEIH